MQRLSCSFFLEKMAQNTVETRQVVIGRETLLRKPWVLGLSYVSCYRHVPTP